MSGKAIIIPERGTVVSATQLLEIEHRHAMKILEIDDIGVLEDYRAKARALESYLRDKEMKGPMLGLQRRSEGRIGQLGLADYEVLEDLVSIEIEADESALVGHDDISLSGH